MLKNVPTEKIPILFAKASQDFEHLPDDYQILKYYTRNFLTAGQSVDSTPKLSSRGDVGYLKEIKAKYPAFGPFLDMFIDYPDKELPEDARKQFFSMLQNPKNFKGA